MKVVSKRKKKRKKKKKRTPNYIAKMTSQLIYWSCLKKKKNSFIGVDSNRWDGKCIGMKVVFEIYT